jgi:hypothetical protein
MSGTAARVNVADALITLDWFVGMVRLAVAVEAAGEDQVRVTQGEEAGRQIHRLARTRALPQHGQVRGLRLSLARSVRLPLERVL